MINKSSLMKYAHKVAKGMVGDYSARLSYGLQKAWKALKESAAGVMLHTIKKETEKAVLAVIGCGLDANGTEREITGWFPKSMMDDHGFVPSWLFGRKVDEASTRGLYNVFFG